MNADSDFPYIEAARQRDPTAFEFLVRKYQHRLFSFMLYYTGNHEDAAECVQETFLQFYTHLHAFRGDSALFTWLTRIAINLAISQKRKKKPMLTDQAECVVQEKPEAEAIRDEIVAEVRQAIRELPDDFRQVILLRDMEGVEYQEIADVLGLPVGTVKSRIYRARGLLAERLKDV